MIVEKFDSVITLNSSPLDEKDAHGWLPVVRGNLQELKHTQTGGCVFRQLHRTRKTVTIKPAISQEDDNASSGGNNVESSYVRGHPVRGGDGHYAEPQIIGTGTGSTSHLFYTPWREVAYYRARESRHAVLQESVLIHELVHCAESAAGMRYCNPLPWNFDTVAEFDAIVVENMYRSEKHLKLAANHDMSNFLPAPNKMVPQADAYKRLLASFKRRMPALIAELAALHVPFNPYRKGANGYVSLS